ncbi:efflux RND transporter periplasmic adaptor subunit [Alicyclobacillaceae bacterium I2511]|nr:efflux RND transporter periplasmic adaptor subunit [Alicyclobacillaceae bacterium I2511]
MSDVGDWVRLPVQEIQTVGRRKLWITVSLVILLLVLTGVTWAVWPRTQKVQVVTISRQNIQNQIFASGDVRPMQRQVVMPSQLTAPVAFVPVHVGQTVLPGQLLVQLQADAQQAAVTAAGVAVREAQQVLWATEQQQQQAPAGFQTQFTGTLSQEKTSLAQAQAQQTEAQAALTQTQVRATFAGLVVLANASGIATDGTPAPIVEVVSPLRQVVVNLSEMDAVQVHRGMSATLTSDAFPNQTWQGHISFVAPYAATSSGGTGQVRVNVSVPHTFSVPYGYQMNVQIISVTHRRVPVIPYTALVQSGSQYAVFVYTNGRVMERTVSLGITTNTQVEVTRGLVAGDTVVMNPPAGLTSGQAVRLNH